MTKITIIAEDPGSAGSGFRAMFNGRESMGKTAGAALDALTDQLSPSESGTLIVVRNFQADAFFNESKQNRLKELLRIRQTAQAAGESMGASEQAELENLIAEELDRSARRAAAMADEMGL